MPIDGMHDLGGLEGFGRVVPEVDEPVFHAPWEARVFALLSALPYALGFSDDQFRPAIERMAPDRYLQTSYYEKWLEALIHLAETRGALTAEELAGGALRPAPGGTAPALGAEAVPGAILAGASQAAPEARDAPRRFAPGQSVITKRVITARHTRLPRYARGVPGRIESVHGAFLLADAHHLGVRRPETLYTVVFSAGDLWGDVAATGDMLSLDLWDSYLDPAP